MPLATITRNRRIEYSILHAPRPVGATIGTFHGEEISEAVMDEFGRLYRYAGVAPLRMDGRFDDEALQPGEFIVQPGLVYRSVSERAT